MTLEGEEEEKPEDHKGANTLPFFVFGRFNVAEANLVKRHHGTGTLNLKVGSKFVMFRRTLFYQLCFYFVLIQAQRFKFVSVGKNVVKVGYSNKGCCILKNLNFVPDSSTRLGVWQRILLSDAPPWKSGEFEPEGGAALSFLN